MGFAVRASNAAAVAAVVGVTATATPLEQSTPMADTYSSATSVALTASSRTLPGSPLTLTLDGGPRGADATQTAAAEDPASVADEIDEWFIDLRRGARTDFHEFANQFGYLGKQLYVAVNFGESLLASAVFNGTDILRGEGVLKNLGEFASDIVLAAVWVAADELYLHLPGLPPIVTLPNRGPEDAPQNWRRPLPPQPGRPLLVPFDPVETTTEELTPADDSDDEGVAEHDAVAEDPDSPDSPDSSDVLPSEIEAAPDADEASDGRKIRNEPTEEPTEAETDEADTEDTTEDSDTDAPDTDDGGTAD